MDHESFDYAVRTFGDDWSGIASLYEAHEEVVHGLANIESGFWSLHGVGRDESRDESKKADAYKDCLTEIENAIRKLKPDWKHDRELILGTLTGLSFKVICCALKGNVDIVCECTDFDDELFECRFRRFDIPEISCEVKAEEIIGALESLGVASWADRYDMGPGIVVCDGETWELRLESPEGLIICQGDNAYPESFNAVHDYLLGLFDLPEK